MPLYLNEADVDVLLSPGGAVAAVEASLERLARGAVANRARVELPLDGGRLAVLAAADPELGVAGAKTFSSFPGGRRAVMVLFAAGRGDLLAVVEADRLGQLRTGAASGVAAKYLAAPGARTLGVIGCGPQAESQVECIRAALPQLDRVWAYCRSRERLQRFCERVGAEPAESHRDAGKRDVVVTATSATDPVLRGEWLSPGALVCAIGANAATARELDNVVLERAGFVCCDSREQAALEAGDLIEPIERGVLDWLEVHELQDVVSGEVQGRQADGDIVVFKLNGLAAWDLAAAAAVLELARERGLGRELQA